MVSRKICRGCCHWRRQRTGVLGPHCGFLMDTGYSRIGQMTGEQRKSGECPFFEKGRQRKTTVKPFIVSPDPLSRLSYGLPGIPKPRRPKYDEDKILTLYDQGKSDKEIAAALECSAEAIRGWRRRRELPANFPRAPSLDTRGVRELYMAGLNDGEIARRVGCTRNAVYVWRKRERLPANYGKEAEKRSFDSLSLAQDDRGGVARSADPQDDRGGVARSAANQDDSKKEVATT